MKINGHTYTFVRVTGEFAGYNVVTDGQVVAWTRGNREDAKSLARQHAEARP